MSIDTAMQRYADASDAAFVARMRAADELDRALSDVLAKLMPTDPLAAAGASAPPSGALAAAPLSLPAAVKQGATAAAAGLFLPEEQSA